MTRKKMICIIGIVLLVIGSTVVYAQAKCQPCGGSGVVTHTPCRGTGKGLSSVVNPDGSRKYNKCIGCDGRGYIVCQTCKGKGSR